MSTYSVRPLFDKESSTLTYLVTDKRTKEAIIIDPVIEEHNKYCTLIKELGINLKYIFETHVHADHITAASKLKANTGAKIVYGQAAKVTEADIALNDGQTLSIGKTIITALHTPGHTEGCYSYVLKSAVFTGDALLIRGCGRTDFQEGQSETLYESVHGKLYSLPDETVMYPGHDYNGNIYSTIGEEKKHNLRLKKSHTKSEFVNIMNNLTLPYPKKIDIAVPANQKAGRGFKVK